MPTGALTHPRAPSTRPHSRVAWKRRGAETAEQAQQFAVWSRPHTQTKFCFLPDLVNTGCCEHKLKLFRSSRLFGKIMLLMLQRVTTLRKNLPKTKALHPYSWQIISGNDSGGLGVSEIDLPSDKLATKSRNAPGPQWGPAAGRVHQRDKTDGPSGN